MALEDRYIYSHYLWLEKIPEFYGIESCFYNHHLGENSRESAQYFVVYHKSYEAKVMAMDIYEEFLNQRSLECLGWRIFKLDDNSPMEMMGEINHFCQWAEIAYNLFSRILLPIPETVGASFSDWLLNQYKGIMDESREKVVRVLDANALLFDISNYYDEEAKRKLRELNAKQGFISKTKYEDRLLEISTENKNCMNLVEMRETYDDLEHVTMDYYDFLEFEKEISNYEHILYAKEKAYVRFDNRTLMVDGKRFDGSKGQDIYAIISVFFRKKDWNDVMALIHVSIFPFLIPKMNEKINVSNGVYNIAMTQYFIYDFNRRMNDYGIKYKIDFTYGKSTAFVIPIIVEAKDAAITHTILEKIMRNCVYHIYNEKREYELYPTIHRDIIRLNEQRRAELTKKK